MDHVYITGPAGTQWDIGSWIDKTQGVDWGAHDLIRQELNQTAFVEGARFAYETAAGARKMTFPLRVPSGGITGLSLNAIEASLRQMVRPNAFVDIQPDGTPTSEMVRFDVLGGDVAHHQYTVDLQRVGRREMTLSLQTQPFGYWPTWITIASVASVAGPFIGATIPAASVIGDIPAFARLVLTPQLPASYVALSDSDFVAWSLAGRPAMPHVLNSISMTNVFNGATTVDQSASWMGVATPYAVVASAQFGAGMKIGMFTLSATYLGRHRVFAVARLAGGNVGNIRLLADLCDTGGVQAIATGNALATVPNIASLAGASYYGVYDLGVISAPNLPELASVGASWSSALRISAFGASDGSLATGILSVAGVMLLPIGGPGGVMPYGMMRVGVGGPAGPHALVMDAAARVVGVKGDASAIFDYPQITAFNYYRAADIGLPFVGGSDRLLQFYSLEHYKASVATTNNGPVTNVPPVVTANQRPLGYTLAYQPRFSFLKGI